MFTSYDEARSWLHSRLKFGVKPGLERMLYMMEKLGHPERIPKYIHVAGTNGKGSTIIFLKEVLQDAEYKVGTFTSPYIETFNERISMDGTPISDEEFIHLANAIKPVVEEVEKTELGAPTEFEIITAMAFYYFGKINIPDIVLLETGLGGLFDSTNIISPLISIITNIGHDHMGILGETIEEITAQKAGIIKSGVPVISAVEQESAQQVIEDVAKSKKAKHYLLGRDFYKQKDNQLIVKTPFKRYNDLFISMKGPHQEKNATLAVMALDYLKVYYSFMIEEENIISGLKKAHWPGRFEELSQKPSIIIDGAHNIEGIKALRETIEVHYPNKKTFILFSALRDKSVQEMIDELSTFAFEMTFTTFDFNRALSAKEMYNIAQIKNKHYKEDWKEAFHQIKEQLGEEDVFLITGSLYFISEVRKYILEME